MLIAKGSQWVDVSNAGQGSGSVDWAAYKAWGAKVVAVKLTESTNFRDPSAPGWAKAAHTAGLAVVGYHFLNPDVSGAAQADYALAYAREIGVPFAMIFGDHETEGFWAQSTIDKTFSDVGYRMVVDFCQRIAVSGITPGWYIGHFSMQQLISAKAVAQDGALVALVDPTQVRHGRARGWTAGSQRRPPSSFPQSVSHWVSYGATVIPRVPLDRADFPANCPLINPWYGTSSLPAQLQGNAPGWGAPPDVWQSQGTGPVDIPGWGPVDLNHALTDLTIGEDVPLTTDDLNAIKAAVAPEVVKELIASTAFKDGILNRLDAFKDAYPNWAWNPDLTNLQAAVDAQGKTIGQILAALQEQPAPVVPTPSTGPVNVTGTLNLTPASDQ